MPEIQYLQSFDAEPLFDLLEEKAKGKYHLYWEISTSRGNINSVSVLHVMTHFADSKVGTFLKPVAKVDRLDDIFIITPEGGTDDEIQDLREVLSIRPRDPWIEN